MCYLVLDTFVNLICTKVNMKVMYCYSVIVTHSVEAVIIKSVFFLVTKGHLLPPIVDIT